MDKDLSRRTRLKGTKWNEERTQYKCADSVDVQVPKNVFKQEQSDSENTND